MAFGVIGIFCQMAIAAQITSTQVENYIVKGNNITQCYFPDIWSAKSLQERANIVQSWENNPDKKHLAWVYRSLYYPLLADSFGEKNAEAIMVGQLDLGKYVEKVPTKERNKTTVKTDKDCKVLWEEVKRLMATYHYFDVSAE